jgi:dipeptidyl aminopeptidase/acylaminoacyl peptidase
LPIELDRIIAKALAKSADERYQSMADLIVDLRAVARSSDTTAGRSVTTVRPTFRPPTPQPKTRLGLWMALAALAGAAVALVLVRPASQPGSEINSFELEQITREAGLSMTPALSPDGNLVAYASDRGSPGALHLWIQQVAGGGAVRLTSDPAADHSPDFSPDGSRIVFRSERSGGGAYLIPALGGEARLAAAGGRRPRFYPDGTQIAN